VKLHFEMRPACLKYSLVGDSMPFVLQVSLNGKSVLITGCDSGFGYELALRLEKMVGIFSSS
jgi:hypothetical protein